MLTFTDQAKEKVQEYLEGAEQEFVGLRFMAARQGRRRFRYDLSMIEKKDVYDEDKVLEMGFVIEDRPEGPYIKAGK